MLSWQNYFTQWHKEMTSMFRDAVTANVSEKYLLLSVCKPDDACVAS